PAHLHAWLHEHGFEADVLMLRRVIEASGRSRAYISGVPATVAQLRELGGALVDIHGQHAHQSLMRTDAQRDMLDDHGGHSALRAAVAAAWKTWRERLRQLNALKNDAEGLALERERLQWQLSEFDQLSLSAGEWADLQTEHHRLAHAQALIEGAAATLAQLDESEDSTHHQLAAASQRMGHLASHDPALGDIVESLESARI